MNSLRRCSFVLLIAFIQLTAASAQGTQARFFTDASGKFRLKATIVDLNETHVKLRKVDGQEVTIAIEKLSESDQKFLNDSYRKYKEMVGDFPIGKKVEIFSTGSWHGGVVLNVQPGKYFIKFDKWSDSWNKWVTVDQLRLPTEQSTDAAVAATPTVKNAAEPTMKDAAATAPANVVTPQIDRYSGPLGITLLQQAPVIDVSSPLAPAPAFVPDPLPTVGKSQPVPATIELTATPIGNPALVAFDPTMKFLAIDPVNFASGTHTATILQLDAPENLWTLDVPSGQSFTGISDNANSAFVEDSALIGSQSTPVYKRFRKQANAEVLELAESSTWVPGVDHVIEETFISNDRLLARKLTELSVWDLKTGTPIAQLKMSGKTMSATSGTGRYLACFDGKDAVVVVDLVSSSVTHRFNLDGLQPLAVSFNPACTKLAITGSGRGEVHDLSTGEKLHEYGLTSAASGELGIAWLGDRYLILQGQVIVDLQTGQPIWQIPFRRQPLLQFDEHTIGEVSGAGSLLQVHWLRLPVEKVMAIAYADPTGGTKIPRGAVATVDVSGLQHSAAEVRARLESLVQSSGYQLGPNGMLQIKLSSTIGSTTKIILKDFLRTSADAQATYTPATITSEMMLDGKRIYQRTREYGTNLEKSTVRLMAGETAQQAVTRLTTPSVDVMVMLPVPYAGGTYHPPSDKPMGTGTLQELKAKLGI